MEERQSSTLRQKCNGFEVPLTASKRQYVKEIFVNTVKNCCGFVVPLTAAGRL